MKTRLSAVSAASNSPLKKATQPSFFQRLNKGKEVTNKKLEVIFEFEFIKERSNRTFRTINRLVFDLNFEKM